MTEQPDSPSPGDEKAKAMVYQDIEQFKDLVQNADVVDVGKDTEYVPDSPRLREDHPNAQ